ncbi:MAG: ABC transporter substrate-binding protein, partial [Bacillota bacterium]
MLAALAGVFLVGAAGLWQWYRRQGDPWAQYRSVRLDPLRTYEVVLWETEMPVAVLADPFRLPGGPNPEPRHGRGRPLPPPAN